MGQVDFDHAILRAVAGVEKKRSVLQGAEKESVAKHECGHALVSTAVATLIPTSPQVSAAVLAWVLSVDAESQLQLWPCLRVQQATHLLP